MAIKTKEEIMTSLHTLIGDSTDDSALGILEDVSDTIDDFTTRTQDSTDWKKKYEDNDAEWRQKYKDRFSGKIDPNEDDFIAPKDDPIKPKTYEDLFKTKENE